MGVTAQRLRSSKPGRAARILVRHDVNISLARNLYLDVDEIAQLSPQLGRNVTCIRITGAIHDVFLSPLSARRQAFDALSNWLIADAPDPSLALW